MQEGPKERFFSNFVDKNEFNEKKSYIALSFTLCHTGPTG